MTQILPTEENVCSHYVRMMILFPLLHPSKVILNAGLLHQEELTGGFK